MKNIALVYKRFQICFRIPYFSFRIRFIGNLKALLNLISGFSWVPVMLFFLNLVSQWGCRKNIKFTQVHECSCICEFSTYIYIWCLYCSIVPPVVTLEKNLQSLGTSRDTAELRQSLWVTRTRTQSTYLVIQLSTSVTFCTQVTFISAFQKSAYFLFVSRPSFILIILF